MSPFISNFFRLMSDKSPSRKPLRFLEDMGNPEKGVSLLKPFSFRDQSEGKKDDKRNHIQHIFSIILFRRFLFLFFSILCFYPW